MRARASPARRETRRVHRDSFGQRRSRDRADLVIDLRSAENLSGSPFVWIADMGLFALPVDARPVDIASPDADAGRRSDFSEACAADPRQGIPARRSPPGGRPRGRGRGPGRYCDRLATVRFAAREPTSSTPGSTASWSTAAGIGSAAGTSSSSSRWTPASIRGSRPVPGLHRARCASAGLARLTPTSGSSSSCASGRICPSTPSQNASTGHSGP